MPRVETGTAVLVGLPLAGLLVGAGLYLGLRERGGAPAPGEASPHVAPSASARPAASVAIALPSAAASGARTELPDASPAGAAPARDEVERRTREQVANALAAAAGELRRACWDALPPPSGAPRASRWVWNFTFDASGAQVGRGLVEQGEFARAEVTACVQAHAPTLRLPEPPGRVVYVEVPFALP